MTCKNSIQNLNKLINSNQIIITDKKTDNNRIETNMIVLSSSNYLFTKIKNFGTDWQLMTSSGNTNPDYYANWSVSFLKFDYRLLSCIDVNVVCKNEVNDIGNEWFWHDDVQTGYYFIIEDIEHETYMKKVTLHAYIYIEPQTTIDNYAKFLIQFINPNRYV